MTRWLLIILGWLAVVLCWQRLAWYYPCCRPRLFCCWPPGALPVLHPDSTTVVVVPFLVWFLFAPLATAQGITARCQVESSAGNCADICRFFVVGEALVGARHTDGNPGYFADLHAASTGY